MLTTDEENLLSDKNEVFIRMFDEDDPDVPLLRMENSESQSKFALSYSYEESFVLKKTFWDHERWRKKLNHSTKSLGCKCCFLWLIIIPLTGFGSLLFGFVSIPFFILIVGALFRVNK